MARGWDKLQLQVLPESIDIFPGTAKVDLRQSIIYFSKSNLLTKSGTPGRAESVFVARRLHPYHGLEGRVSRRPRKEIWMQ